MQNLFPFPRQFKMKIFILEITKMQGFQKILEIPSGTSFLGITGIANGTSDTST